MTYHNDYIESEWWSLKQIWEKGMLYLGHKIAPYCPRCGTALSSHEVAQGYKNVKEVSAIARFHVKGMKNTSFLAWTTTPVDAAQQRGAVREPRRRPTCRFTLRRRRLYHGQGAGGEGLSMGKEVRSFTTKFAGQSLGGHGVRAAVSISWSPRAASAWVVVADNYVTMDGRHRHRPHRTRLRRGRQPRLQAERHLPFVQSGGHAGLR